VFSQDLLTGRLGVSADRLNDTDTKRLSKAMQRLGWIGPKKLREGDRTMRGYERPATPEALARAAETARHLEGGADAGEARGTHNRQRAVMMGVPSVPAAGGHGGTDNR